MRGKYLVVVGPRQCTRVLYAINIVWCGTELTRNITKKL